MSGNLIVQLGAATEQLNRSWYERNTGRRVIDVQRKVKHSAIPWMAATLDGIVEATEAVFEAKFMLPWSFCEEAAAEKYMAQAQHNMWVTHLRTSVLSIITGGGKWVEITIPMDPLYLSVQRRLAKGGPGSRPACRLQGQIRVRLRLVTSHTTGVDKDVAKYFVSAATIRDFMPVEFRP